MSTDVIERPLAGEENRERPWAEWRGSIDALTWSPWFFLCWLDPIEGDKYVCGPHVWQYNFMQARALRPPDPPEYSPIFTWDTPCPPAQ